MPKRYWYVILTYVIMQLSSIIAGPILFALFPDNYLEAAIYWMILSFTAALIITLYLMKSDMQMPSTRGASDVGQVIGWSILGLFMAYFAQGIATYIEIYILGIEAGSQNTMDIMQIARALPLFMIVPAIIAPILEEIIFRKIIFGSLHNHMNFFLAALLSSLVFGIVHGELEHMLIYASMGFVFAYLYVKTKRILTPIIVHAAMNSITVIVQFSYTPEELQKQLEQLQMILIGG
ncbi:CPBP family intramembrane glutamic endopeptidase [Oceanobacillus bengalensis]|uniref:CPBP family intramembrane metalloprotease n=1 Tax=Oceanobacillus bengalensis TaxID=1435466 RepID=A0A494YTG1_9BACI|nr:type II CAAX endopeptidase family protein [Oceanobacillus bengalensis]RKQ13402.1 CPBP family intramembrane metalloprotease [Oceanobacillus bengalensis]